MNTISSAYNYIKANPLSSAFCITSASNNALNRLNENHLINRLFLGFQFSKGSLSVRALNAIGFTVITAATALYTPSLTWVEPISLLGTELLLSKLNQRDISEKAYIALAADLKYSNGQNVNPSFRYAMMLMKGEGGDKNIKEGIKYLQFAAKRGHIESQLKLAQIEIKTRDDRISELSRLYADSKKEIVKLKETNNTLTLQASMRTLPNTVSCLFDEDRILSKFTCLISQDPCVAPVLDPIGNVLYEEDQILHWLKTNKTSPTTNLPLTVEQLKPLPKLNALIQSRLKFLKSCSIEKGLKVLSNQKAIQEAYAEMKEHCPKLIYLFDDLLVDPPSLEALDLHKPVRDEAAVRPHHEYLDLAK